MPEHVIKLSANVRCCSHFARFTETSSCGALTPLAFQSLRLIPEDFAILLSHARLLKSLSCWLSITMPNIDSCSRLKFKMSSTFLWSTARRFFVTDFSSECARGG